MLQIQQNVKDVIAKFKIATIAIKMAKTIWSA
jgi:hypothetical protein